jgi:two-component system sensor histidine kinase RpfC
MQKLLYISRESGDRNHVTRHLASWEIELEQVSSCARAFARLINAADAGSPLPIVLMDATRLDSNPAYFAHTIRFDYQLDGVRLVLITPAVGEQECIRLKHAGYSSLLDIPVDKTLLFNALHDKPCPPGSLTDIPQIIDRYQQSRSPVSPMEILVCEPDEINRRIITRLLEREHHKVFQASDGEQALQALENHAFDLAIIGMDIPVITANEVVSTYRITHINRLDMPFIMLTDSAATDIREAGVDAVLTRPVKPRALLDALAEVCQQNRSGLTDAAGKTALRNATVRSMYQNLPVLDLSLLKELEELGRNYAFLGHLSKSFLGDMDQLLQQMTHAFAQQDHAHFIDCAHALKSSAASIGANVLYDLCARACQSVPADWGSEVLSLLHEIEDATKSTRASLNAYLEHYKQNLSEA